MKKTLLIAALMSTGLFANALTDAATESAKSTATEAVKAEAGKVVDAAVEKVAPTKEAKEEANATKEEAK